MAPQDDIGAGIAAGQKYFSLALKFAGGIMLFLMAGFGLDRLLGLTPVLTILGTLGGATVSCVSVYRELMADAAKAKSRAQGPP